MLRIHSAACFVLLATVASACARAEEAKNNLSASTVSAAGENGEGGSAASSLTTDQQNTGGKETAEEETDPPMRCVPGREQACQCQNGLQGSQTCNDHERYDPCVCEGSATGGEAGASGVPTGTAGSAGAANTNPANGGAGGSGSSEVATSGFGGVEDVSANGSAGDESVDQAAGGAAPSVSQGGSAGETVVDLSDGGGAGSAPADPVCFDVVMFIVTIQKECVAGICETFGVGTLWTDLGDITCSDADDRVDCLVPLARSQGKIHASFNAYAVPHPQAWMPGLVDGECMVPRAHSIRQVLPDNTAVELEELPYREDGELIEGENGVYYGIHNGGSGCHWRIIPLSCS